MTQPPNPLKPHQCECGRWFGSAADRQRHAMDTHQKHRKEFARNRPADLGPVRCGVDDCNQSFANEWNATQHRLAAHGVPMRGTPRVFVDMDGVLADFDSGYEQVFGIRPNKADDNVDWDRVRAHAGFYESLPPMPDMRELWDFVSRSAVPPAILTGVPASVEEAPANKIAWVRKHLGDVEVICCRSRDKSLFGLSRDILIDDWEKYRSLWETKGRRWITHTSARSTISQLLTMAEVGK